MKRIRMMMKKKNKELVVVLPIIVTILVVTFVVDFQIANISDYVPERLVTNEGIAVFVGIAVVFAVGGILLLRYVNNKTKNEEKKKEESSATKTPLHLHTMHIGVTIVQYVLIAIIAFVVAQILLTAQYNAVSTVVTLFISYGLWIVILSLLSKAFVSWVRATGGSTKKRNLVVLVLTLSMISSVVSGVTMLSAYTIMWHEQPNREIVTSADIAFFPEFEAESLYSQLSLTYQIAAMTSYVLTWIGTVILLRPYIRKIGRKKFYAIMGAAMVYYLVGFPLFVLGYYTPTGAAGSVQNAMNNVLIFGTATVLSGVIFGIAFLSVARTLRKDSPLRGYMMIAAYGFILFYVAGSGMVTQLAYPPYGLASVAFTGLSCYLIYVGLYSAAVSVSQDYQIRESIRKSVMKESHAFLESIGTAQQQQEREKAILTIQKKNAEVLAEESGGAVKPSLDESDMKEYLDEVVKEMEAMRSKKERSS
jgi:hypothetical protein